MQLGLERLGPARGDSAAQRVSYSGAAGEVRAALEEKINALLVTCSFRFKSHEKPSNESLGSKKKEKTKVRQRQTAKRGKAGRLGTVRNWSSGETVGVSMPCLPGKREALSSSPVSLPPKKTEKKRKRKKPINIFHLRPILTKKSKEGSTH